MASPTLRTLATTMQAASSNKDKLILPLVVGGLTVCLLVVLTVIILLLCKHNDKRRHSEEGVESTQQVTLLVRFNNWRARRKQNSINRRIGAGDRNPVESARISKGYDVVRTPVLDRASRRSPLVHMPSISECGTIASRCHSDAGFVTEHSLERDGDVSLQSDCDRDGRVVHTVPDFVASEVAYCNDRRNSAPIRILTSVSVVPVQANDVSRRGLDVAGRNSIPLVEEHSGVGQELHVYARVDEPGRPRVSESGNFQLVSQYRQSSMDGPLDPKSSEYIILTKGGPRFSMPSSLPRYDPPDYVPQRNGRSMSMDVDVKLKNVQRQGKLVDPELTMSDKQGSNYASYASICSNQGSLFDAEKAEQKVRTKTS